MPYIIYETTNTVNGKIYVGVHKTDNPSEFDGYLGSGKILGFAIEKYGRENFIRKTLEIHETLDIAQQREAEIVNPEFVSRSDVYNITIGGNVPPAMTYWTLEQRERHSQNMSIWATERAINRNPSKLAAGENHWSRNTQTVKDSEGNTSRVSNVDPRLLSGELIPVNTGKVSVRDKDGNQFAVSVNDPRYISGELISIYGQVNLDKVVVKDSSGQTFQVSVDDPRYLSGELIFHLIGKKHSTETKLKMSSDRKGKKFQIVVCPHCGKHGGFSAMGRWHFENCKMKENTD